MLSPGWYGLVAARTYLKLRPTTNILIIDSDSTVGGVWSKERLYPNLVAQVRLGVRLLYRLTYNSNLLTNISPAIQLF